MTTLICSVRAAAPTEISMVNIIVDTRANNFANHVMWLPWLQAPASRRIYK